MKQNNFFKLPKVIFLLLLFFSFLNKSHATDLGKGDLFYTMISTDGDDNFSFVLLKDISGTTTVYFTDSGWNPVSNTWLTNEGTLTWTYTGNLSAGTEITITKSKSLAVAVSHGLIIRTGSFSLSGTGDVIIAYRGSLGSPSEFIAAFNTRGNGWPTNPTVSSVESGLPTGLTNGTNALGTTTHKDDWRYLCVSGTSGDVATLRGLLANESKWEKGETVYAAPNCGITIGAVNNAPNIGGASAGQVVNDNNTINLFSGITIADADGDNVTATITLDTNAKGVLSGTDLSGSGPYTIASKTAANMQSTIRALSFNPTDNRASTSETTTFTVAINDATATTNNNTTTVISAAVAPTASSIAVSGSPAASATSVSFLVTFNESVTGVDTSDFTTDTSGSVTGSITSVSGSGTTRTVTVTSVSGSGTLSIDLKSSSTGIVDSGSKAISGGFTAGATHTVNVLVAPTITFANVNKTFGDANFDLAATSNSAGAITYTIEGANTTGTTLSGTSNKTVNIGNVGSLTIRATQAANGIYSSGTKDITFTIIKANQSITFGALASKTFGDIPFALTGTASSGLTLTYVSSNTAVATVSGSTVTIVGAGFTNITASQAGNTNYSAASNVIQGLTVGKANQTITFGALADKNVGDAAFNLTATASSGLATTYISSNTGVATVSGSTVTIVAVGTTTITANQSGNSNYNAATGVPQSLTVNASLGVGDTNIIGFSLYPNPTKDLIHISAKSKFNRVQVFSTSGQRVLDKKQNSISFKIDLSNLESGLFLLKAFSDDGIKTILVIKK